MWGQDQGRQCMCVQDQDVCVCVCVRIKVGPELRRVVPVVCGQRTECWGAGVWKQRTWQVPLLPLLAETSLCLFHVGLVTERVDGRKMRWRSWTGYADQEVLSSFWDLCTRQSQGFSASASASPATPTTWALWPWVGPCFVFLSCQ